MLLNLRPANVSDADVLQSLYTVIDSESLRLAPAHFVRGLRRLASIERRLADPDSAIFIVYCGDVPAGFIHAQLQEPDDDGVAKRERFVCIWDIAVREGYRRLGAGTLLLETALDWGKANGAAACRLNVLANNAAALRFYEKHSFAPVLLTLEAGL